MLLSANAVLAARSAGNRLRRVQRETNQKFRRLVQDEPALESLGNHPLLPNNHIESLKHLKNLVRKLEMQGELERYNDIIQTQLSQGIVQRADEVVKDGKEFYIPHKAVLRENAESTKIRIVYDASARANASAPSLNECLEIGPPLQDQLWNVPIRNRFYPVAIAGDLK